MIRVRFQECQSGCWVGENPEKGEITWGCYGNSGGNILRAAPICGNLEERERII